MFRTMVKGWFRNSRSEYNGFIKALLVDDIKAMNHYMNKVALNTFSSFDTGNKPSETSEPERFLTEKATTMGLTEPNPSICFYHGFVLGLLVELSDRYTITSNQESGFGRYDVMLEPKKDDDGIILEFKVQDPEDEKELTDTVQAALRQIEDKKYETAFIDKGVPKEKIRKYGFAFCGKNVLIGTMT